MRPCGSFGSATNWGRPWDRTGCWKPIAGGGSLKQVLLSIARSIMAGTPNGIVMDAASGLLFSPSHFTWMDTNYPAGTPRQGYPIEIQALWQAALDYLGRVDAPRASQAVESIWPIRCGNPSLDLFYRDELGYLSDCLHAAPGTPAAMQWPTTRCGPTSFSP
jgi:starch synthase (maltosyl-transferring)